MAAGRERRPQALERYRGQTTGRRHHGVYHYQRQTGRHPHPHRYAARKRVAERPQAHNGNGHSQAPLHHHQHVTSQRHHSAAWHAAATLEVGQIIAYDAASGAAMVQVLGSPVQVIGPIAVTACAPRDLALVGAACLVALLDAHNPRDGVVTAVWPAPGSGAGTKLTQVGVATIALAGASTGSVGLVFPSTYAAAPAVVATATDSAWTAAVAAITAAGCTLTIRAAAPATTAVTVNWIACGV